MDISTKQPPKPIYLPIVITFDTKAEATQLYRYLGNTFPNDADERIPAHVAKLYEGLHILLKERN